MTSLADELQPSIDALNDLLTTAWPDEIEEHCARVKDEIQRIAASWSMSNLDYQAACYYGDFEPPPPGRRFSVEWGLSGVGLSNDTTGWEQRSYDDILQRLAWLGVAPQLDRLSTASKACDAAFREHKERVLSILSAALSSPNGYLDAVGQRIKQLGTVTENELLRSTTAGRTVMTRDPMANAALVPGPHQVLAAKLGAMESAVVAGRELLQEAEHAANHIRLLERRQIRASRAAGTSVFIGHGRSPLWRELKDFVEARLHVQCDEFNRVPAAGVTTVARLSQMLDDAAVALLVMTAEDETPLGSYRARQNVVHEAGLFQGRLGFEKAIVLLEDGCEDFSNIDGLGQIRFPQGNIAAIFEAVREVLEREGLIAPVPPAPQ